MLDSAGQLRPIKVPALYVPASGARLLSTTSLLQSYPDETMMADSSKCTLSGIPFDPA